MTDGSIVRFIKKRQLLIEYVYLLTHGEMLSERIDKLREDFALITTGEKRYPKEDRPFEEKATVPERLGKIKNKYFQSIQNFMNQFAGFLAKEEQKQRLAMVNLITAQRLNSSERFAPNKHRWDR